MKKNKTHLDLYYIDLDTSFGEDFTEYDFTEKNIPLVRFNHSDKWQHNPVTVCQYGLHQYNLYLRTSNDDAKIRFLNQAKWLVENHENGPNNSAVWYYKIDIPFYKLKRKWISGMAQGEALSVLLRAFQLTGDTEFLNTAQKSWPIFSVNVENGGVIGCYEDGNPVIEEYPTIPGAAVLNGFILGLFGVYDYWKVTADINAKTLFQDCISGLKNNLHLYDTHYWSYYDLWHPFRLTSKAYHRLHIELLKKLYLLTDVSFFKEKSIQWNNYLKNPLNTIKWASNKIKYKIRYE